MAAIAFPGDTDDGLIGGRYRFLSLLGQGGMGVTSRYWDIVSGRPVVLKQPRREFVEKPGFLERFDREVRLMRSFQHPHVVPIIDAGTHDGLPFIVMPFLPGGSLSVRRLRDADGKPQPNTPSMLHLWLPEIAAALDFVHAHGAVHRDVKPANIFFDAFWTAYLGDFGVAKVVDETGGIDKEQTLTGTNVAVGTEFYMGPELFTPKHVLTGAVDQYALAVLVYEMVCGKRPFTGETAHVVVEVTTKAAPPLDRQQPGLPARLVQAVHRGLAKRPGERFASCTAFAQAVLADVPPMADEPDVARLACPKCGHVIKIGTSDAGKRGRCPKCSKRLVIAADLAALWTRDEEAIVAGQPAAAWPGGDEGTPAPMEESADEDSGRVFKPLSRPTPLPRRKRMTEQQRKLVAIGLTLLGVIAIAPFVIPPRRAGPALDRKAGRVTDEQRLQVFPPVGWRRVESPLLEGLVIYEPRNGKRVPLIRVLRGADPPQTAQLTTVQNKRLTLWSAPAPRIGIPDKLTARVCAVTVDDRTYSVEVTVPADEAEDAEKLAKLVACGLKEAPPGEFVPRIKTGLKAEYFRDRDLRRSTGLSDVWHDIDIDWSAGPPRGVPPHNYSVRWTGFLVPRQSGLHTFSGVRDDGLRLTINGQRIVDEWKIGAADYESRPIVLEKDRRYPITIELFNGGGPGRLTLRWKEPVGQADVVPSECLLPGP